jgi:hypothetical protein
MQRQRHHLSLIIFILNSTHYSGTLCHEMRNKSVYSSPDTTASTREPNTNLNNDLLMIACRQYEFHSSIVLFNL